MSGPHLHTAVMALHALDASLALVGGLIALRFPNGAPRRRRIGRLDPAGWVVPLDRLLPRPGATYPAWGLWTMAAAPFAVIPPYLARLDRRHGFRGRPASA